MFVTQVYSIFIFLFHFCACIFIYSYENWFSWLLLFLVPCLPDVFFILMVVSTMSFMFCRSLIVLFDHIVLLSTSHCLSLYCLSLYCVSHYYCVSYCHLLLFWSLPTHNVMSILAQFSGTIERLYIFDA